ncbi:MAG: protein kinase [Planctomycetota bacterium]
MSTHSQDGAASGHDDEAFLDEILTRVLDDVAEGRSIQVQELVRERPHLRADVEALVLGAREASVCRSPVLPEVAGYRIERELGHGGMGTVYLARHVALGRLVALKVLPAASALSARARERFLAEARALAKIKHPNVVTIHDVLEEGDLCAYAMEWIEGLSLAEVLRDAKSETTEAARPAFFCHLAIAVARALGEVHRAGLLHRDVKPSNILLRRDGTPVLVDFGLVREASSSDLTRTGDFLGTPAYAAPEQLRGDSRLIDARADIYSLGVTLYQAVSGRLPYQGTSSTEILEQIESRPPAPLRKLHLRLPRDLETIVAKAIEPDRDARYATADELADDLERLLNLQPIMARPPRWQTRAVKFLRRHRRTVLGVMVSGVAVALLSVLFSLYLLERAGRAERYDSHLRRARLALLRREQTDVTYEAVWLDRPAEIRQIRRDPGELALAEYEQALAIQPEAISAQLERQVCLLARAISRQTPLAAIISAEFRQRYPLTCEMAELWSAGVAGAEIEEARLRAADPADRRALGLLAFLCGPAELCIRAWSGLDVSSASDPLIDAALGQAYLASEEPGRAVLRLARAFDAFPEAGCLAVDLARAALENGDVELAGRYLHRAEELSATGSAHRHLRSPVSTWGPTIASYYLETGRSEEARYLLEWLYARYKTPLVLLTYGRFLEGQGEWEGAVRVYRMVAAWRPEAPGNRDRLSRALERWWAAKTALEQVLTCIRSVDGSDRAWDVFVTLVQTLRTDHDGFFQESTTPVPAAASPNSQWLTFDTISRTMEDLEMIRHLHPLLKKLFVLESLFRRAAAGGPRRPAASSPVAAALSTVQVLPAWALRSIGIALITAAAWTGLSDSSAEAQDLWHSWEGLGPGDRFGTVAGMGDLNGDGIEDIAVGADQNNVGPGYVIVYSGADPGQAIHTWHGENGDDRFGNYVACIGDVDDDGVNDIAVSAHNYDGGTSDRGKIYVYSGASGALLWTKQGSGWGANLGRSVRGGLDFNGDGCPDVVVGEPDTGYGSGSAYVLSGRDGTVLHTFHGEQDYDSLGLSVDLLDVNADGFADVVAGACRYDSAGTDAGRAYIFLGPDGRPHCTLDGTAAGDFFGIACRRAGDLDRDGSDDFLIGADQRGSGSGKVYLYSGQTCSLICEWQGEGFDDWFGAETSVADDVNGDGYIDLLFGARGHDTGDKTDNGAAYLYSGAAHRLLWKWAGDESGDLFGCSTGPAGDIDDDGLADVLVGALFHDGTGGTNSGRAYLFLGNDLFLQADPTEVDPGATLSLETRGGPAQRRAYLVITSVNGYPKFIVLLAGWTDANGEWPVVLTSPGTVGNLEVTFRTYVVATPPVIDSNDQTVLFR